MLGAAARAQDPLREFEQNFREGVRQGAAAEEPEDFTAALRLLAAARDLVDALPEERRGLARFWTEVRRAEVFFGRGDVGRARRELLEARGHARASEAGAARPVYSGYYRVLLLVLLWQAMQENEERFFEIVEVDEAEFVFDAATLADVEKRESKLYVPLVMLRAELLSREGKELEATRMLSDLADETTQRPKTPDEWRVKCVESVAWHYITRLDLDRADVYLEGLAPDQALELRARIAYRRGDLVLAEKVARQLVEAQPAHRFLLAEILEDGLKWDEALEQYQLAQGEVDPDDSRRRTILLNSIGDCHLGRGELDAAERHYKAALVALEASGDKLLEAERGQMVMDLGRLEERKGNRAAALDWFVEALDATEAWRREIPMDPLGAAWLSSYHVDPSIDGVIRNAPASDFGPFVALAATERAKARGLLDWIEQPPHGEDAGRLRAAVRRLALSSDPGTLDEQRLALDRARNLAQRVGVRSAETLGAEALRSMVAAERGTLFLSYWVGQEDVVVFAARGGADQLAMFSLGDRQRAIELMRGAFVSVRDPVPEPWAALDAASAFFLPEAVAKLMEGAARVVFCPDAWLGRLPFEALRVSGTPVGVRKRVERAPSLSVRAALAQRERQGERVVVVDDVATPADVETRLGVDPLVDSRREGDAVAGHYSVPMKHEVQRLSGEAATVDGLAAALQREAASLVHINAHAVASPFVPSRSLLLLADGPISMASLAGLPLGGSVVVLSACSSADGEARGGEGVAGLLWGPMAAGARAVVASLWAVNQEATAELMSVFHEHRSYGLGEAAALREAREQLAASSRFAHPHYWAGFATFGGYPRNPALKAEPTPWWVLVIGAGTLGLVALWWLDRLRGRAGGSAP